MKHTGELMGLFNILRNARNLWRQYCLEASCNSAINIWEDERPEYIGKIRRWVEEDQIPNDMDTCKEARLRFGKAEIQN